MKRAIISSILLAWCCVCVGQQTKPMNNTTLSKQDYLQKARAQKTVGWILLGGGAAITVTGAVLFKDQFTIFGKEKGQSGAVMIVAGIAAMGGSIPFFIASAKNKAKAAMVSADIRLQQYPNIKQGRISCNSYPAVTIRISL